MCTQYYCISIIIIILVTCRAWCGASLSCLSSTSVVRLRLLCTSLRPPAHERVPVCVPGTVIPESIFHEKSESKLIRESTIIRV